jgi:proton-translocating NADH-quinone oxidoreductase chain M
VFFEAILMPLFIMIGVWGSRERKVWAAYQFFLYTLFGSVFMLIAIIFVYLHAGFTDFYTLSYVSFSLNRQFILWILFFFGFAIKVPMFPVHIWLPEAHVEAPTAGSVLLAGVLLKLGTYGVLRFLIPLFPVASMYFAPLVFLFSLLGVCYASLSTLTQVDLKKIVAYSSVAHMSFVVLGLFGFNIQAVSGSIFLMLSHGLVSGGLFFLVGFIYERYKTRLLPYYGGLVTLMPIYSFFFLSFSLSNMALPGTSSFIGEFLIMLGLFSFNSVAVFVGSFGMVFSAAYSLWLYNRLLTGSLKSLFIRFYSDLTSREFVIMFVLFFFVIFTGFYPSLFLDIMSPYTYMFYEHILF